MPFTVLTDAQAKFDWRKHSEAGKGSRTPFSCPLLITSARLTRDFDSYAQSYYFTVRFLVDATDAIVWFSRGEQV
jgi:hypothetical protein